MRFRNQISITGKSGVGTSTLVTELRNHFIDPRWRWVSAGEIFRRRGAEFGFPDINAFAAFNRLHPEAGHDKWCDEQIAEAAKSDGVVGEGRIVQHFMPWAFHVLVICGTKVCAERRR